MPCPHFKEDNCAVQKKKPSNEHLKEFCIRDEEQHTQCPFFILKQSQSKMTFDLRTIPDNLYEGLRKLDFSKIVSLIIQQMITTLTKCKKCESAKNTLPKESNFCFEHHLRLQKIVYVFQEIHGFNNQSPINFYSAKHGPFNNKLNKLLKTQVALTLWKDSKTIGPELTVSEMNLVKKLVGQYNKMKLLDLELLATSHQEYSHLKTEPFDLMDDIKDHYENPDEFEEELKLFKKPLDDTLKKLEHIFEPVKALGVGSSGITIKLRDKHLGYEGSVIFRVLKFPRPKSNAFRISNLKIIKEEIELLYSLNHDRIVKVILADETPYNDLELPWYIMEYIGPSKNLRQYLETEKISKLPNIKDLINIVTDISSAVQYLHQKEIFHCDIKSDNILIKMEERPIAMLTDLGYARAKKGDGEEEIPVRFDFVNAHPFLRKKLSKTSDPAALMAIIKRKELDPRFDLYALGFTIQDILNIIEKRFEDEKISNAFDQRDYDFRYLKLTMCRLISAGAYPSINNKPNDDLPSLDKHFKGLNNDNLLELAYENSEDLVEDLLKLNNITLESWIPELNPSAKDVIALGAKETRVTLTDRLKKILEHKDFDRLGSISQLGLITFVYPSAKHTRLEHSLGTYAHTCEYIRALWYNRHDPLFKSIMKKEDLCSIMLAALLHDVGYYPLAHDLEDCRRWRDSEIRHEQYASRIIEEQLANIIEKEWKVKSKDVAKIIRGEAILFKEKILHDIINGPIDADKLDYLLRDGMHLGLPYAEGIDKQWFLRNLTVAYDPKIKPSIAVTEKGRVTAESIAIVRFNMFSVAYWHHTVRAFKAMLKYAIEKLDNEKIDEKKHFDWFQQLPYANTDFKKMKDARKVIEYTDFLQLCWIRDKLDENGKAMIDLILQRKLFKRIKVVEKNSPDTGSIYNKLIKIEAVDIEKMRVKLEQKLRKYLVDEGFTKVSNLDPLILIDVPKVPDESDQLYVVSELGCQPISQNSIIWDQLVTHMSESLGKIRFFVHPEIKENINQIFSNLDLSTLISKIVDGPESYSRS